MRLGLASNVRDREAMSAASDRIRSRDCLRGAEKARPWTEYWDDDCRRVWLRRVYGERVWGECEDGIRTWVPWRIDIEVPARFSSMAAATWATELGTTSSEFCVSVNTVTLEFDHF